MGATIMTMPTPQIRVTPISATVVDMDLEVLARMERAVLKVQERLLRATAALNQARVRYAVVGGHAVASWVATVDEGAVRNTRDVDLLVRRGDLQTITDSLERVGFVGGELLDVVMFRDGPEGKPSEAIHLLFSGEKIRPEHTLLAPEIETVENPANYPVLTLPLLVMMKLLSNRLKDKVHIQDMIGVGLIDRVAGWTRFRPNSPSGYKRSWTTRTDSQENSSCYVTLVLSGPGVSHS